MCCFVWLPLTQLARYQKCLLRSLYLVIEGVREPRVSPAPYTFAFASTGTLGSVRLARAANAAHPPNGCRRKLVGGRVSCRHLGSGGLLHHTGTVVRWDQSQRKPLSPPIRFKADHAIVLVNSAKRFGRSDVVPALRAMCGTRFAGIEQNACAFDFLGNAVLLCPPKGIQYTPLQYTPFVFWCMRDIGSRCCCSC